MAKTTKTAYPESSLERAHLRDALRRRGVEGIDEFAAAIQQRWGHSPLRSYRLALELSLEQVCDQVNRLLGVFAGEAGCFDHSTLSKLENWPTNPRRPTVSHLAALSQVYATTPRRLIAPSDWDRLPPADQYALAVLDRAATTGTTGPAGDLGMMGTARPQAGRTPLVPPTPWGAPEAIRSGNPIERSVVMTGEESTQYADRGGNLGETTLELLQESVATEAGRFANIDRLTLFGTVRLLRDRIFAYLDGGQPIRQRRDLYFLGAAACGMLANVSNDLGSPTAAMSQARAGHVFAVEAGDPALTAWLYAQQSTFCYWNGQPGKAREYARRGAALNPGGTVGVWLPAVEARASGELGDAEGTRRAVHRAAEIRDTVQQGTLDGFGGIMVINPAKQHFYAAGAFLGIGDDQTVIAEAAKAVDTYLNGPAEDCAHDNVAAARCHAAIAHVRAGDLDAAGELAGAALQISPQHRSAHVDKAARRLHAQLGTAAVRSSPLAIGTRDQIEDFLSTTPTNPNLS